MFVTCSFIDYKNTICAKLGVISLDEVIRYISTDKNVLFPFQVSRRIYLSSCNFTYFKIQEMNSLFKPFMCSRILEIEFFIYVS